MRTVSALTIASGRTEHLENVILGLAAQTVQPAELVIAVMQDALYEDLPQTAFPVRQIRVPPVEGELPLAAARNRAAEAATGEIFVFLDVDCIPHPALVADYAERAAPGRGVLMGEVKYLPQGTVSGGLDFERFERAGVRHSDRQGPPEGGLRRCDDYRCFWSLNFAIHRDDWRAAGGMDERYVGYGGEDTDFGRELDCAEIPIWWMKGARVYHQYHPHYMPPIHKVASVIRNSELFASKWGHRTMEHWLHGFRMLGLIEPTPDGLRILREPGEADYALCRQAPDMPYANTRRVLDKLQQIEAAQRHGAEREAQVERDQADLLRHPAQ